MQELRYRLLKLMLQREIAAFLKDRKQKNNQDRNPNQRQIHLNGFPMHPEIRRTHVIAE